MAADPRPSRWQHPALLFLLLWAALVLVHWPLLRLPYLWDEAYFVTIARDLMLSGDPIPSSVPSNGHPPLVFAYLAAAWKLFGYQPLVTRVAMLAWAAFGLAELFQLARRLGGLPLALAVVACVAVYPVYFAQSSLAHLDLPAAALTIAAFRRYLDRRTAAAAALFALAALAKETAIFAPLLLALLEFRRGRRKASVLLVAPASALLAVWFAYHWTRTGYAFGNPQFFHENVVATLNPLWILAALATRLWHLIGHMNLWALTVPALWLWWRRRRPADPMLDEFVAAVVLLAIGFGVALSLLGGALLARYLLPVVPLILCGGLALIQRATRRLAPVTVAAVLLFWAANYLPPLLPTAVEDSLAYRDSVVLQQRAAELLSAYRGRSVLASWPLPNLMARPYLGYTSAPMPVREISNLTTDEVQAARAGPRFDVALLMEHRQPTLIDALPWTATLRARLGRRQLLSPEAAAELLGGRVVQRERRGPASFVLIEFAGP